MASALNQGKKRLPYLYRPTIRKQPVKYFSLDIHAPPVMNINKVLLDIFSMHF